MSEKQKVYEALVTSHKVILHLKNGSYLKGVLKRLNGTNVTVVGIKDGLVGMWAEKLDQVTFVSDMDTEEVLYS